MRVGAIPMPQAIKQREEREFSSEQTSPSESTGGRYELILRLDEPNAGSSLLSDQLSFSGWFYLPHGSDAPPELSVLF